MGEQAMKKPAPILAALSLVLAPFVLAPERVAALPTGPDRDADGVADVDDLCPSLPEDRDGFEEEDGCPDPDNDRDGVLDVSDGCPNDPETRNGHQDDDGCPD
jgi:hypothetical protein